MGKHIDELEKHFIESIEKDGIQHSIRWFDKWYEALVRAEVRDEIAGLPDVWEVRRAHIATRALGAARRADSSSSSNASNMLARAAAKVWAEEAERHLREDLRRWDKEAEVAYDASIQPQPEIGLDSFELQNRQQELVIDNPIIKLWLARVDAAMTAMQGVEVEFATILQERCEETMVYHDHDNQLVAQFLPPKIRSVDDGGSMDEESLPYYRIRFEDGVEILADTSELFSLDPRFMEMICAVSGAFACARELGYVGPWHLAADGAEEEKAEFLRTYEALKIEIPPKHWADCPNTPERFRHAIASEKPKG